MYTDLEKKAYKIYTDFMKTEWCFNWNSIEYFVNSKKSYQSYFDEAVIKIRKDKLKKISKVSKNAE